MKRLLARVGSFCLAVSLFTAGAGEAQSIRGAVTGREGGEPIAGAVVQLVGDGDRSAGGSLTDTAGGFLLRAPSPGTYRVRVDRIGFARETSAPVELARGATVEMSLAIDASPISLHGITARGRSRGCTIRESGEVVSRVWEEARKALQVVSLTQASGLVTFDTESFRRERDPRTGEVLTEQRRAAFGISGNPFQSVPAEELATHGYVMTFPDSTVYHGPDAAVLLSDAFLATHCFRISDEVAADPGLIGLEFRPVRNAGRPDVAGVLWLDRATSQLRSVDYRYVGHATGAAAEVAGGRVEFQRIEPSGAWIVREWVIRMPQLTLQRQIAWSRGSFSTDGRVIVKVSAVREEGGEVIAVRPPAPAGRRDGTGSIVGTVVDSLTGAPLPGAFVFLSGTNLSDSTDAEGRYRIDRIRPGRHVVSFLHPRLHEVGALPPQRVATMGDGDEATLDLAVPSVETMLRSYCPDAGDDERMIAGLVRERASGRPVAGARVAVGWRYASRLEAGSLVPAAAGRGRVSPEGARFEVDREEIEVTTDDAGFYRICGVPLGAALDLVATVGERTVRRSLPVSGVRVLARDLLIERP